MVDLCIARYRPDQYIRPLRIETGGQTAMTHLAFVKTDQGDRRAYVKAYLPTAGMGLLNEIIGYTMAHHAGLAQPTGALINLSTAYLHQLFPAAVFAGQQCPCFVSIDAEDTLRRRVGTAKALFGDNLRLLAASLQNWPAYALMVALDEWLANIDRNTGNLLMVGIDDYQVIDHGHLLTGPNWTAEDMNPEQWSANKMLDLVFDAPNLPLPMKNAILKSAENFLKVYAMARDELNVWLAGQTSSAKLLAHHFIWQRAETTPTLLKDRIQLIA